MTCIAALIAVLAICAGFEAGMVFAVRVRLLPGHTSMTTNVMTVACISSG